jgi:hypothetical protein
VIIVNNLSLITYKKRNLPSPNLNIKEVVYSQGEKIHWDAIDHQSFIGIAVGSRGIKDIDLIVKATVELVRDKGHEPVIIPAMGSHGGGKAEGQLKVLAALGITKESMGCPIWASGESSRIGEVNGVPVYFSTEALQCQGIILINRIKSHTSFHGSIESGLVKMAAIGLGNSAGATEIHKLGLRGLRDIIPQAGEFIIEHTPIIFGLGIIKNEQREIALIQGILGKDILEVEPKLLELAKGKMAKLPVDKLDILIIEEMGKNYSGTGIDTNVIGRLRVNGSNEPDSPQIQRIIILDLSAGSFGNATGIGLADFVTKGILPKIDWDITYKNVLTTTFTQRAMLPIVMATEAEAIRAAAKSLGFKLDHNLRVMKIKNTLELGVVRVSENLCSELEAFGQWLKIGALEGIPLS